MEFAAAEKYLSELQMFGIKLGLDNVCRLAEISGVGADSAVVQKMRFIHLAGSNGKGSTGAMLEIMLRNTGSCTGFYTSPHLIIPRERIRVNGNAVAEDLWLSAFEEVCSGVEELKRQGFYPTYFEFQTVLALVIFARSGVEWVVWESGMGGRLDASNFIRYSEYCLITGIALEHCQYLGNTLEEIAGEKAGIIKPGSRVFTGCMPAEAENVIAAQAAEKNAGFYAFGPEDMPEKKGFDGECQLLCSAAAGEFRLSVAGAMQRRNSGLALKVWRDICADDDTKFREGVKALSEVRWPCRFEFAGPESVVDGGHNPDGIKAFVEACREAVADGMLPDKLNIIFGAFADKDATAELEMLVPVVGHIIFVPVAGDGDRKDHPADKLMEQWRKLSSAPCSAAESVITAWNKLEGQPRGVCGSLFIAGELLAGMAGKEAACNLNKSWRKNNG